MAPSPSVAAQLRIAIPHLACLVGVIAREHTEAEVVAADAAAGITARGRPSRTPAATRQSAGAPASSAGSQVEATPDATADAVAHALLCGVTHADANVDGGALFTLVLQVTRDCARRFEAVRVAVRKDKMAGDRLGQRVAGAGDSSDAAMLQALHQLSLG